MEGKEPEHKILVTIHWEDGTEEHVGCNFFGISNESENVFILGNDSDGEMVPTHFININRTWKLEVEPYEESAPAFVPTIV